MADVQSSNCGLAVTGELDLHEIRTDSVPPQDRCRRRLDHGRPPRMTEKEGIDGRRHSEIAIAVQVLNRVLEFGRAEYVRTA